MLFEFDQSKAPETQTVKPEKDHRLVLIAGATGYVGGRRRLTPKLSSLWLGLVTPVFARIGGKLIESIRHPAVVQDPSALEQFAIRPVGVREAIAEALRK